MIKNTDAIILKKTKYSESSLIVKFYTKKYGKITCLVKGAYRKGKYDSQFDLFSLNHIVFYEKPNNNLNILSKCDLIESYIFIRKDIYKTSSAMYFIDLINLSIEENDINIALYNLLLMVFSFLTQGIDREKINRIFEIKLLYLSGLVPRIDACLSCGGKIGKDVWFSKKLGGLLCKKCFEEDIKAVKLLPGTVLSLNKLINDDAEFLKRLEFTKAVSIQLKNVISEFLNYHFGNSAKSVEFLNQLEKISV